jgi:DNA topoisomerase I
VTARVTERRRLLDADVRELAVEAGLRIVDPDEPGHRRIRRGRGFQFVDRRGRTLAGPERRRLAALAVPPAWTDVWLAPWPDAHLLAVGTDDAGRRQYRYHDRWRELADAQKFARLAHLGSRLAHLRARVHDDLAGDDPVRHTLATVVRLIDRSLIRIGDPDDAAQRGTFGATTLRSDHVTVDDARIGLRFPAKGGQEQVVEIVDPVLAAALERGLDDERDAVFQVGDEPGRPISATAVNDYLRELAGARITAKDLRTWGATVTVVDSLAASGGGDDALLAAIDRAAARLGNTRAVCRGSYVAPAVIDAHDDGRLAAAWRRSRRGRWVTRAEGATTRIMDDDRGARC